MDSKQQIEFLINHAEVRVTSCEKAVKSCLDSLNREAVEAREAFADGRSLTCFATNCSMRAMELAQLSGELEKQKALLKRMYEMLDMLVG